MLETDISNENEQTILIHANKNLGISRLRQGFVHGISYESGRDYSTTIKLIKALKPKSWRLSRYGNVYAFVVRAARLPQTLGTQIVFNLQDLFNMRYGFNLRIKPICLWKRKNCFSSYDNFRKSWLGVVNAAIRTDAKKRFTVNYIDIFAEPDYGTGKLPLTPAELGDIFRSTYFTVLRYRPGIRIVAPSISSFRERYLKRFLAYIAENNFRLDAVSWHEFNAPEALPSHVNVIRSFIRKRHGLCNPRCPEIHINEYGSERQQTAGYGVGWLYYLEAAHVDQANRACWDFGNGESTCWAGFDGLLLQDNVTPRPLYWVYKAYADMGGSRILSESSSPQTVALASKDDSKGGIRILAGKFGQKGASGRVLIKISALHRDVSSVVAEISRIPDSGSILEALPSPLSPVKEVINVKDHSVFLAIPNFRDEEAYSIVVRSYDKRSAL